MLARTHALLIPRTHPRSHPRTLTSTTITPLHSLPVHKHFLPPLPCLTAPPLYHHHHHTPHQTSPPLFLPPHKRSPTSVLSRYTHRVPKAHSAGPEKRGAPVRRTLSTLQYPVRVSAHPRHRPDACDCNAVAVAVAVFPRVTNGGRQVCVCGFGVWWPCARFMVGVAFVLSCWVRMYESSRKRCRLYAHYMNDMCAIHLVTVVVCRPYVE